MKTLKKLYTLIILIIFSACVGSVEEQIGDTTNPDPEQPILEIPANFDFKTQNEVIITINDSEDRTFYKIYTQFGTTDVADEDAELNFDEVVKDGIIYKERLTATTKNGVLVKTLQVPSYSDKVFIRRKGTNGFTDYVETFAGNSIVLTHSKKAVKQKSTFAAKDKKIKGNLNKDIFIADDAEVSGGLNSNGFDVEVLGDLEIKGSANLSGTTTIIAEEIEIKGSLNLNGATIYAKEIEVKGSVNGPGNIYYCDEYEVKGRVNQNQGTSIFQKKCGDDDDNDGVSNGNDSNPNNSEEAFEMYYPSKTGYATVVFEDLWPSFGDYDFNDVSLRYRAKVVMDSDNEVIRIDFLTKVISNGAGFTNAFGIELEEVKSNDIESVTGAKYSHDYLDIKSNGTENRQKNAVIIFTDDQDNFMEETTISVVFKKSKELEDIGDFPFNPFIIKNMKREYEIHLPYHSTTDLGRKNVSFSGVNRDSDGNFISENGYPWAMHIPEQIAIPKEKVRIDEAYNHFIDWATSGGTNKKDWFKSKSGYRNSSKLK